MTLHLKSVSDCWEMMSIFLAHKQGSGTLYYDVSNSHVCKYRRFDRVQDKKRMKEGKQ